MITFGFSGSQAGSYNGSSLVAGGSLVGTLSDPDQILMRFRWSSGLESLMTVPGIDLVLVMADSAIEADLGLVLPSFR